MNMVVLDICGRVIQEVCDSVKKHGDWSDYSVKEMHTAVTGELSELHQAYYENDVLGPHGIVREAIQSCACLVKLVAQLETRNGL